MKKLLPCLLILAMLFSMFAVTTVSASEGDASVADDRIYKIPEDEETYAIDDVTYNVIWTANDFAKLTDGGKYVFGTDIDLNDVTVSLSSDALKVGTVEVKYDCDTSCELKLFDADGNLIYQGNDDSFTVSEPSLWWCNGQGAPYLYRWVLSSGGDERTGRIGFRRIRLVRNEGADGSREFPMGPYPSPATIELNGRRILAKGSNCPSCSGELRPRSATMSFWCLQETRI